MHVRDFNKLATHAAGDIDENYTHYIKWMENVFDTTHGSMLCRKELSIKSCTAKKHRRSNELLWRQITCSLFETDFTDPDDIMVIIHVKDFDRLGSHAKWNIDAFYDTDNKEKMDNIHK